MAPRAQKRKSSGGKTVPAPPAKRRAPNATDPEEIERRALTRLTKAALIERCTKGNIDITTLKLNKDMVEALVQQKFPQIGAEDSGSQDEEEMDLEEGGGEDDEALEDGSNIEVVATIEGDDALEDSNGGRSDAENDGKEDTESRLTPINEHLPRSYLAEKLYWSRQSRDDLREECSVRNLSIDGTEGEMIGRILKWTFDDSEYVGLARCRPHVPTLYAKVDNDKEAEKKTSKQCSDSSDISSSSNSFDSADTDWAARKRKLDDDEEHREPYDPLIFRKNSARNAPPIGRWVNHEKYYYKTLLEAAQANPKEKWATKIMWEYAQQAQTQQVTAVAGKANTEKPSTADQNLEVEQVQPKDKKTMEQDDALEEDNDVSEAQMTEEVMEEDSGVEEGGEPTQPLPLTSKSEDEHDSLFEE